MNIIKKHKILMYISAIFGLESFIAPVMTLFFLDYIGADFSEFSFFQIIIFAFSGVLEIPTGAISDSIGRKKALLIANLIYLSAMLILIILPSHESLYIAAILYPLGAALGSGNFSAITYESFARENKLAEYRSILSRTSGLSFFSGGIACLLGGYLAAIHLALPLIIDSILFFTTIIISLFLLEDDLVIKESETHPYKNIKKSYQIFWQGIKYVSEKPHFLTIALLSGSYFAIVRGVFITQQPLMVEYGLSFKDLGLGFAVFNMVAALGSFISKHFELKLKSVTGVSIGITLIGIMSSLILILNITISPFLVILAITLQQLIRGIYPPIFSFYISHRIPQNHQSRTTLLSIAHFMQFLLCGISFAITGSFHSHYGYRLAFIGTTLLFSACSIFLLLIYNLTGSKEKNIGKSFYQEVV